MRQRTLIVAALLVVMTVIAYWPAMTNGGFVWDDDDYVTRNETLKDVPGLVRIWTEPGATPQYYPLVFTTYWLEARLWGQDNPQGYHVTNVLLHLIAALLLWRLLHRLGVPGAWVAAAIFAVHPVHVESVAWITERKNVLSGVFYLLAGTLFLKGVSGFRFQVSGREEPGGTHPPLPASRCFAATSRGPLPGGDHGGVGQAPAEGKVPSSGLPRRSPMAKAGGVDSAEPKTGWVRWAYVLSFVCFLLALWSKTVTATLPAALLLVIWWKHGRIKRREVLMTVPFFVVGLMLSAVTVWMEKTHVGAEGADWELSFLDRCLIAGRALWFYVVKLVLPFGLTFNYPRWEISSSAAWQHLFPLAAAAAVFTLWERRKKLGRGPLAAVLFFAGTLFPALGFFDVYPMKYSFVADHFQYLASIGLIVLFVAVGRLLAKGLNWMRDRIGLEIGDTESFLATVVLIVLALVSWNQCLAYRNIEELWKHTLAKNPNSWLANNNLGFLYQQKGEYKEAEPYLSKAVKMEPKEIKSLCNLAATWTKLGREADAIRLLMQALAIDPDSAVVHYNLGVRLAQVGQTQRAAFHYFQSIARDPTQAKPHNNLANLMMSVRRDADAKRHYEEALRLDPDYVEAHSNYGVLLSQIGKKQEGLRHCRKAVQLDPDLAEVRFNLGAVLAHWGYAVEAEQEYVAAVRLDERFAFSLGMFRSNRGDVRGAIDAFQTVLSNNPNSAVAHNFLAVELVKQGREGEAEALLRRAVELDPKYEKARDNLAVIEEQKAKFEGELAQLREDLEQTPNDGQKWKQLGLKLVVRGEHGEMLNAFENAAKYLPDDHEVHNNLGVLYGMKDDFANAFKHLNRAIELKPDYDEARGNLDFLKRKQLWREMNPPGGDDSMIR